MVFQIDSRNDNIKCHRITASLSQQVTHDSKIVYDRKVIKVKGLSMTGR